jgi:outer membrane receptor protein involved in Fe transport
VIKNLISLFLFTLVCISVSVAQNITGVIEDPESGEKLFGAAVLEKGTSNGAVTDFDGKFTLKITAGMPATLVISYVGYENQEYVVSDFNEKIKIKLKASNIQLESVTVTDTRITEKQKESPVTVESMDAMAVKETAAVNFYDGLGSLKGVDLTAASMGFKVVNTRGFNSTRPVRSLQIIDGVDNQAPGLNFSVGNFAGSSELDIQRVELIVGANSALYGPNAFNGVISMTTKDPFVHQGLDVMGKVGERNLMETAVRFARGHKLFGSKEEVVAYKLNFSYMQALDWEADNYDPTDQSKVDKNNPGGYDAVNRYGDENLIPGINDFSDNFGQLQLPGMGIVHRTGYLEVDLVDYNTKNLKVSPSIQFKLPKDIRAKFTYNYGTGTTVYQGDNRYSLKDLKMEQYIGEISRKDQFFIRAYQTVEDAGKSYDAVFTALLLQKAVKSDQHWSEDYRTYWQDKYVKKVRNLPGYPDPNNPMYTELWFGDSRDSTQRLAQFVISENIDSLYNWHNRTRLFADGKGNANANNLPRYEPGTAAFDSAFNSITSRQTFLEGGSGFYDKSSLTHYQAQLELSENELHINNFKVLFGGNYRQYRPNSNGTIFSDTNGVVITNSEYGLYSSLEQRVMDKKLILTATGRMDKNENFDYLFSPAASAVYLLKENNSVRLSFSSAIRNPTLQDQYLYYNVGRAILIGNLNGFEDLVTVPSFFDAYDSTVFNSKRLDTFSVNPVRPERVRTIEMGYKGQLRKNIFIDASYYYSWYKDFLGYVVGATLKGEKNFPLIDHVYRVTANSDNKVTTQGFSIGLNYYFKKFYALNGNYSWNVLNKSSVDDPIIPAFNTPEHKYNIGISARDLVLRIGDKVIKKFGFNINYKWIQGHLFEGSPQFTGNIPTYDILDGQLSYTAERIHTTFKLGASNMLNKMNYQTYGGPRVGRLAYFSVLFELDRL